MYERLGSPEGELVIAQAVVFMACAAKSNAVYTAFDAAMADAREHGTLEVPLRLRNAPFLEQRIVYAFMRRVASDRQQHCIRAFRPCRIGDFKSRRGPRLRADCPGIEHALGKQLGDFRRARA